MLEAAFTSGRDVANMVLSVIGALLFRGFDSRSKIAKIHAPLLFFHGERDEIIPLKLGRRLFEGSRPHRSRSSSSKFLGRDIMIWLRQQD